MDLKMRVGIVDVFRSRCASLTGGPDARHERSGITRAVSDALVVLTATDTGIAGITLFNQRSLFAAFGFPRAISSRAGGSRAGC
jgi:hypothetical protein